MYKYGYPRLEEIHKFKIKNKSVADKKIILIAPSWGSNSITNLCIENIIQNLIIENFEVIYRPHNMSLINNKKIIDKILHKFSKFKNFKYDNSNNAFDSLLKADLLIADWGSTAADFSLGLEKPVIFIDTPPKIKNKDYKYIFSSAFEFEIKKNIGHIIEINNIKILPKKIAQVVD